jgi:serine/threonine protein kinase
MAFDMFCPNCNTVLTGTPQRCSTCGNLATLAPGTEVQGSVDEYTVDSILGIGGMGIVYKAQDTIGNDVVVKELYVDNPADQFDAQRRFFREADIQASISNPAFAKGFGYFQDAKLGGRIFMTMEYVEGEDLEKVLTKQLTGKMDEDEVLQIGIQVCDGLEAMHNYRDVNTGLPDPLIHRDIKPANIILTPAGTIKILDLGIARAVRQSAGTQARQTQAGTAEYAMPEVVLGVPTVRSDIGALAATMYHLVMGQAFPPMDWDTWLVMVDNLPTSWQAIFRKALAKDQYLRHKTIGEFRADLVGLLPQALQSQYITAPPQHVPQPMPTAQVSVLWNPITPAMLPSLNEYRAVVAGRVIQSGQGLAGINVTIPLISDTGGKGVTTTTQIHGDFSLGLGDTTVPVGIRQRQITVVVEDPNTGAELYREVVSINRPASFQRAKAGAWNVIAAPFRAFGQWRQNRQLRKHQKLAQMAPMIQAKAQARQAQIAAKAQAYQARQAARLANQQSKQAARQAKAKAKAQAQAARAQAIAQGGYTPTWAYIAIALGILFFLLAVLGVAKDWIWLLTICPWLVVLSMRLYSFAKTGELNKNNAIRMIMPRLTTLWVGMWLIYVFTRVI